MQRRVGKLEEASPADCSDYNYYFDTDEGEVFTAACTAVGEAERGVLGFNVSVIRDDGEWALRGFHVKLKSMRDTPKEILVSYDVDKISAASPSAGFGNEKSVNAFGDSRAHESFNFHASWKAVGIGAHSSVAGISFEQE